MINVSNAFKERMKHSRRFLTRAEVTFADGNTLSLSPADFSISGNSITDGAGQSALPLGVAVEKIIQLELFKDRFSTEGIPNYDFFGAKIRLYTDFSLTGNSLTGKNILQRDKFLGLPYVEDIQGTASGYGVILPESDETVEFQSMALFDGETLEIGESYTISFTADADGDTQLYFDFSNNAFDGFLREPGVDVGTNPRRYSLDVLLTNDEDLQSVCLRFMRLSASANHQIRIYDIQIEKGDTATDYEPDAVIESIAHGTYTVTTPESYGETITVAAQDEMYKADKPYDLNLDYPITAQALLQTVCEKCGIYLTTSIIPNGNFKISAVPDGMTYRQIIGYIAMIAGGNARINRTNALEIIPYSFDFSDPNSVHTLQEWSNNSFKTDINDITITGIQTTREAEDGEDETLLSGADGYVIAVENPLVAGSEADLIAYLAAIFVGKSFRRFDGSHIAYPLSEFMDRAKVVDRRGNEYYTILTDIDFRYNGFTTLKNSAESPMRAGSTYTSPQNKTLVATRQMVQQEAKKREQATKYLEEMIAGGSGMYQTSVIQPDGSSILYMHDKPTLDESGNVIKITSDAIGFSTDGGKTYPFGITLDGDAITRLLYAEGINADYINAGAITVRDDSGSVIFSVDMDEKKVFIGGKGVTLGGDGVIDAINSGEGKIILNGKRLEINSENLTLDEDGLLTATNVSLTGSFSSQTSSDAIYIDSGTIVVFRGRQQIMQSGVQELSFGDTKLYQYGFYGGGEYGGLCFGEYDINGDTVIPHPYYRLQTGYLYGIDGNIRHHFTGDAKFDDTVTANRIVAGNIKTGTVSVTFGSSDTQTVNVTFDTPFASAPVVVGSGVFAVSGGTLIPDGGWFMVTYTTTTRFTLTAKRATNEYSAHYSWIAIG